MGVLAQAIFVQVERSLCTTAATLCLRTTASRRSSALLVLLAACCGLCALRAAFVAPPSEGPGLRGSAVSQQDLAKLAAAGAVVSLPEAAHARLPDEFVIFAPIVDVMPVLPFFFFLLAFLWQASVGFR